MGAVLRRTGMFLVCLALISCGRPNQHAATPKAVHGVLDLRQWDFAHDGLVDLAGEWAFYWGALYTPEQTSAYAPTSYVEAPNSWTSYTVDGQSLPAEGYATYRLLLDLPDSSRIYGIYINGEGAAYSLWVDGVLLAQNGRVANNRQAMVPRNQPTSVFFQPGSKSTQIVLQISNFHHRKAGFRNNALIGLANDIQAYQRNLWAEDAFSLGIFLVLGTYHLFIYGYRRNNVAPLYFAAWCILYFIRTSVLGQNLLQVLIPGLSWDLALRIEYLTFYLSPSIYALFIFALYPHDFPRIAVRIVVGLGIVFSLGIFVLDTLPLSYTIPVYQAVILGEIMYTVFFLVRILVRRRPEARYVGLASAVIFAGVILEILAIQDIIPYQINPVYGFIGFIFIQAIMLSSRLSRSFYRVEVLSAELELANLNLLRSEQKYRGIFEDSKDLIFITDMDGKIVDSNAASNEILGYTPIELMNRDITDLLVHQSDRAWVRNMLDSEGLVRDSKLELKRKDGRTILALVTLTMRKDHNGKISGVQGQVHDISLRERAQEFQQLAFTDPLTKVYNRRFLDEIAAQEWERAKQSGSAFAIIVLDIDHFKQINDTYGHAVGDQVLINIARLCQENMRGSDIFARYGGEEFIALMPGIDRAAAYSSAERLRHMVAARPLASVDGADIAVTISVGVTVEGGHDPQDLATCINHADQALYESKKAGRNLVTVWQAT